MLLMGLRLTEGIDEARFLSRTGIPLDAALDPDTLARALEENYLVRADGRVRATAEGRKRLDSLLAMLVV
jgi:oxygen-independent coproporphyrinogen-3 oxidase